MYGKIVIHDTTQGLVVFCFFCFFFFPAVDDEGYLNSESI